MKKISLSFLLVILLSSCGDFPDYRYEQSDDLCVMSFPFAGGLIGRKYIGYFNLVSTLQFLDGDPEYSAFIGEPSHIELETGSVQTIEIAGKIYRPQFEKTYTNGELQYWGPAFTLTDADATQIYQDLQDGYDMTITGRLEVGKQYETDIYNFFFSGDDEPFRNCINRLLTEEDLQKIEKQRAAGNFQPKSGSEPEIESDSVSDSSFNSIPNS